MVTTLCAVIILLGAAIVLPLWVQLALYSAAVILVPYRILLLVPALVADILYSHTAVLTLANLRTTLFVALILSIHWFITTKLRRTYTYDLETK